MLPRQISISRELREDFSAVDRAEARYLNSRESILNRSRASLPLARVSGGTCTAKEAPWVPAPHRTFAYQPFENVIPPKHSGRPADVSRGKSVNHAGSEEIVVCA